MKNQFQKIAKGQTSLLNSVMSESYSAQVYWSYKTTAWRVEDEIDELVFNSVYSSILEKVFINEEHFR